METEFEGLAPGEKADLEAKRVIVVAETVIVGQKKKKGQSVEVVRRYKGNVALFTFVVGLTIWWFELHVQSWLSEAVVIGLPALWTVWRLVRALLKKDFGEDAEALRNTLLASAGARENILFAGGVALLLLTFTGSIFVKLAPDAKLEKVRLEFRNAKQELLLDRVELTPAARIAGRLFVPQAKSEIVTVTVLEPRGYTLKTREPLRLGPTSAINLTF
ncbi:MAG TPA: hypothetical protein VN605_10160, partial [Thermoanaerobaculia bacterium]|nr:hypothetical protein [Thermoanaerobaculia bacterium]